MSTSRRRFLSQTGSSAAALAAFARPPEFLLQAAAAPPKEDKDTVLVVVQLTGGNDGLNTIVPFGDDLYYKNRPELGVARDSVLRIDDYLGFHPALSGFEKLFQQGRLAILQGVGYPNPNRSHFESMDIWHSCQRKHKKRETGWLGRSLEAAYRGRVGQLPAIHFGAEEQPLALAARQLRVPSLKSVESFQLQGSTANRKALKQLASVKRQSDNPLLGFVQSSSDAALAASQQLAGTGKDYRAKAEYPSAEIGKKLSTIARLINTDLGTRVFYVTLDGFDTHARQADAHTVLLRQLGDAAHAFLTDVAGHGHGERVLLLAFSEFGRRVKENASAGTDHGTAAPLFCAGAAVQGGLVGKHPRLDKLVDGDLVHHTDFRQVYATVLEDHLGWQAEPVLGAQYKKLPLVAKG